MNDGVERVPAPGGEELTFRPVGAARVTGIVFLGIWLCGWLVGEAIVLRVLGVPLDLPFPPKLPRGVSGPPLVFLGVWALVWTLGGLGALFAWLRLVGGRDVVRIAGDGLTIRRELFGKGRARFVPAGEIVRFELRRSDGTLVVHAGRAPVPLTGFGTREARRALLAELRARYGVRAPEELPPPASGEPALPPRWEASLRPGGEWVVRPSAAARRQMSGCLASLALVFVAAAAWHARGGLEGLRGVRFVPFAILALLGVGALALTAAREEIAVWPARLDLRRRLGPWSRTRSFVGASLRATATLSEGDEWIRLEVVGAERSARLWSGVGDRATPVLLGRWLAARTGWRFEEPGPAA